MGVVSKKIYSLLKRYIRRNAARVVALIDDVLFERAQRCGK